MTIDQLISKVVEQGALGILLVLAVLLFWRMTDRYLISLEKLTSQQDAERREREAAQLIEHNSWLLALSKNTESLTEHTKAAKELNKLFIEHDRWEHDQSTTVLEHIKGMTQWFMEQHEKGVRR